LSVFGGSGNYGGGGSSASVAGATTFGGGAYGPSGGTANTGGGGGAWNGTNPSGPGGSGVVVLKSPIAAASVTGTFTTITTGGFTYYRFTAGSGTITF
jgi:hypothetical protein